jgi:hypothetical protein
MVGDSIKPRISDYVCDEPDIRLLFGIEAEDAEGTPERT